MYIKSIHWLFGKPNYAAKLIITDGYHECIAFCYLAGVEAQHCFCVEGHILKEPLLGFVNRIKKVLPLQPAINAYSERIEQLMPHGLAYHGIGQLLDENHKIIKVGHFLICLDHIPNNAKAGEYLQFQCSRFEVAEIEQYARDLSADR